MKSYRTIIVIPFAIIVLTGKTFSQREECKTHFSVVGGFGTAWTGMKEHVFKPNPNTISIIGSRTAPVYPGISGGLGIETGPLVHLLGMEMHSSVEIWYGEEGATYEFSNGSTIKWKVKRMPVMVWGKFVSKTDLSPFLRIGVGAARTDMNEITDYPGGQNYVLHEWHFSLGLGGGFRYRALEYMTLELFLDEWFSFQKITREFNNGTTEFGIFDTAALGIPGFRILYTL